MAEPGAVLDLLEALEPAVYTSPARRHEIDEERQIVDAGVSLGEQVSLEPLEPAYRLIQETADLGNVPRDREHLDAEAISDGRADLFRQRALEFRGCLRERLDLNARARERRLELYRRHPSGRRVRDPRFRSLENLFVHGREATLRVGWTRRNSSTSCLRT